MKVNIDQKTFISARQALRKAVQGLIYDPNVMLIDFGWPETNCELEKDKLAIRVHAIKKYRGPALEAAIDEGRTLAEFPRSIDGFRVDVPERVYRLQPSYVGSWRRRTTPRACRLDPMKGGISISSAYKNIYATLGGLVADRHSGARMILSNWHVLVGDWWVQPGRPICQPGVRDGGGKADTVATLSHHAMSSNLDAAVAELTGSRLLINDQFDLGPVKGVGWALVGMEVLKSGRRTGVTYGVVTGIEGILRMSYRGVDRLIRNVVTIEPHHPLETVSSDGDSGSFWLEESTMYAIGLHFAGSDDPKSALAMDMQPVLEALNVDMIF